MSFISVLQMYLFNTVRSTLATLAAAACFGIVFHNVAADAQTYSVSPSPFGGYSVTGPSGYSGSYSAGPFGGGTYTDNSGNSVDYSPSPFGGGTYTYR